MATTNTLFALLGATKPAEIEVRFEKISPWLSLKVSHDDWLIVAPSSTTTQEICDALGLPDGTVGNAIVVRVENYWGRGAAATWEWITAKMGVAIDAPAK